MTPSLYANDLAEHGLTLVPPSDPSFEARVANLIEARPNAYLVRNLPVDFLRAAKPFSVFLENNNERPLVAYQLIWEVVNDDGIMHTSPSSYANPGALMGHADHPATINTGCAIAPGKSRFFSLVGEVNHLPGDGTDEGYGYSYGSHKVTRKGDEELPLPDEIEALDLDALSKLHFARMARYHRINVSLDGAFFSDGTFVGPNAGGFFEQISAQVNSQRDILKHIELGLKRGYSPAKILAPLQKMAGGQNLEFEPGSNPADYYAYFKQRFAREIVRFTEPHIENEQECLSIFNNRIKDLARPWVTLRKV